ncbi:hypothetical protein B0H03_11153 [Rathayibacter iranicus NCPPB 2253 = VKM Ac-1602]|uniref:Substrate-binding family protein n=1 Tax=Rathayibacter iranicus NCPPB 2253 = VKM Ac-1602 TaxID=1328868 RepID=A0ABX5LDN6_9MICO|nr:hypothetical protein B0H03_11153 [Rathayibacter iranicus NCPPB 2253 = VKM Ac-1602]
MVSHHSGDHSYAQRVTLLPTELLIRSSTRP